MEEVVSSARCLIRSVMIMINQFSTVAALFVAHTGTLPAAAFVPSVAYRQSRGGSWTMRNDLRGNTPDPRELSAASADMPNKQPPWDETSTLVGKVRELLGAPDSPYAWERYDAIGKTTGGIWQSNCMGFLPTTVCACNDLAHGCVLPLSVLRVCCVSLCPET